MRPVPWIAPLLLALVLLTLAPVSTAVAQTELARWEFELDGPIGDIAVDAAGNIFFTSEHYLFKIDQGGNLLFQIYRGSDFLAHPQGVALDEDENVYVVNTYDHGVHKFTNPGEWITSWHGPPGGAYLGSPFGIAIDATSQEVYVRTSGHIDRFTSDGDYLGSWFSPGGPGIAVDDNGFVYVGESNTIFKYTQDGTLHRQFSDRSGTFRKATGLAVDSHGYIYVATGGPILVYDKQGRYRMSFSHGRNVCLDDQENIYLYQESLETIVKYSPLTNIPGPPPPPPEPEPAMVMLHIADDTHGTDTCERGPTRVEDIVTEADASEEGPRYYVYLLMSPGGEESGLAGLQAGIEYHRSGGPPDSNPLRVLDWRSCSDLEFPQDHWPASGTGNTLTWLAPGNCRLGDVVTVGYFYVAAYGSSVMGVIPFPTTGVIKVANCTAEELLPDQTLAPDLVGWVSMGRGEVGTDTDGCNPAVSPCAYVPVPVRKTTWGRVKSMYGR